MSKMDEVREILGQLDLYLTYDGYLSNKDIDAILSLEINGYTLQQLIETAARVDKDSRLAMVRRESKIPERIHSSTFKTTLYIESAIRLELERAGFVREIPE